MIRKVNRVLCAGCGACEEACPTGAIRLIDHWAEIDNSLCTQCDACIGACPNGAIEVVSEPSPIKQMVKKTATEINPGQSIPAPSTTEQAPQALAPLAGAALAFLGREIVPRLVDGLIRALERRFSAPEKSTPTSMITSPQRSVGTRRGRMKQARYRGGQFKNRKEQQGGNQFTRT